MFQHVYFKINVVPFIRNIVMVKDKTAALAKDKKVHYRCYCLYNQWQVLVTTIALTVVVRSK